MEQPAIFVERTLAIIKPDAIDQSSAILRFIEDHGFAILQVSKSAVKRFPHYLVIIVLDVVLQRLS